MATSYTQCDCGGGGTGDVVGPASSTDNALVRFDGTTGKLIQNSSATVSDAGVLATAQLNIGGGTFASGFAATIRQPDNGDFTALKLMSLNELAFLMIGRSGFQAPSGMLMDTPVLNYTDQTATTGAPILRLIVGDAASDILEVRSKNLATVFAKISSTGILTAAAANLGTGATGSTWTLNVAPTSGSNAKSTALIFDNTPTTGSTKLRIKAGAGQDVTGTDFIFEIVDASGTALCYYDVGNNAFSYPQTRLGNGANGTWAANGIECRNDFMLKWSATSNAVSAKDAGFSRNAAGVIEVNDGTTPGTFRDLKLRTLIANATVRFKGYTVATLPSGTVGDNAYVTDALAPTFLATVVGGGAIVTPVFYNGSAWVGA